MHTCMSMICHLSLDLSEQSPGYIWLSPVCCSEGIHGQTVYTLARHVRSMHTGGMKTSLLLPGLTNTHEGRAVFCMYALAERRERNSPQPDTLQNCPFLRAPLVDCNPEPTAFQTEKSPADLHGHPSLSGPPPPSACQ